MGLNEDLLESVRGRVASWRSEHEVFFEPFAFMEFAVQSSLAPQVVEDPFVNLVLEIADRARGFKQELWPRGHTKTSIFNALAAFLLCDYDQHIWGKQIRIALCGEKKAMATRNVKKIRTALETNTYILERYGSQRPSRQWVKERARELLGEDADPEAISPPEWTQTMIRTANCLEGEIETRTVHEEPSLWSQGMIEGGTGRHGNVYLVDDPVGKASFKSPAMKERCSDVFADLKSQMLTDGLLVDIGTRWADDDIHNEIQSDYHDSFDISVRTCWGNGPELYRDDFKVDEDGFYTPKCGLDRMEMLWDGYGQLEEEIAQGYRNPPEQRKRKAVHLLVRDKMFQMNSAVWSKQFLNRVVSVEEQTFFDWMFKEYSTNAISNARLRTYTLTDSATGKDSKSSYRVVATVGLDADDTAYVMDLDFGRWGPEEYAIKKLDHYQRFHPRFIVYEKVAWQEAFRTVMEMKCRMIGMDLPRVKFVTGRSLLSKVERMEGLEPRFRSGRIFFSPHLKHKQCEDRNVWDEIVRQFSRVHECDQVKGLLLDIPDALSDIDARDEKGGRLCRPHKRRSPGVNAPMTPKVVASEVMEPLRSRRETARTGKPGDLWGRKKERKSGSLWR